MQFLSPPHSPVKAVDLFGTPSKNSTPKRIRDESPPPAACLCLQIPSPPKKIKSNMTKVADTLGLPILRIPLVFGNLLGRGSFGEVREVRLPNSPLYIAMKSVQPGKLPAKMLRYEADNFGLPGCAHGVPMGGSDGEYYVFLSICIPLNKMNQIGFENLEYVVKMTNDAIGMAPINVVFDAKPENFGFIPRGTPTVERDENGQPCVGPLTSSDDVTIFDMGIILSPDEADKAFSPLLDDDDLLTEEQQTNFRNFKCEMMEALLRNQFADVPEEQMLIVARICTKYGWRYAGGQKYQPDFSD
jgi:hypothetical protein